MKRYCILDGDECALVEEKLDEAGIDYDWGPLDRLIVENDEDCDEVEDILDECVFRCLIVYAYNKTADCAESGSSSAPANPTQNVEYPEKGGELNHNLAKRHPKGAFSFLENAHSMRFFVCFANSQRKQKRLENREMVLQPGPVAHNHSGTQSLCSV